MIGIRHATRHPPDSRCATTPLNAAEGRPSVIERAAAQVQVGDRIHYTREGTSVELTVGSIAFLDGALQIVDDHGIGVLRLQASDEVQVDWPEAAVQDLRRALARAIRKGR